MGLLYSSLWVDFPAREGLTDIVKFQPPEPVPCAVRSFRCVCVILSL